MDQIWIAAAAVIAAAVLGVPFAAIVLVSIASRREEAAHSLSRQAPGAATRAARRLLGYRNPRSGQMPAWPASYSRAHGRRSDRSGQDSFPFELMPAPVASALAPSPAVPAAREVRFGHARRPLSDAGQYPASRQPQPRPVRADERQGAGV
jgi:hypothetical protein